MVESRCGILCSACQFRRDGACAGCLHTTEQFWGACPVKACCLERNLVHCGQCENFPCPLLESFAYDKAQGDEGKRITQCAAWCREEQG